MIFEGISRFLPSSAWYILRACSIGQYFSVPSWGNKNSCPWFRSNHYPQRFHKNTSERINLCFGASVPLWPIMKLATKTLRHIENHFHPFDCPGMSGWGTIYKRYSYYTCDWTGESGIRYTFFIFTIESTKSLITA